MFEKFWLDKASFWIGFAAATVIWWVFQQVRPALKTVRQIIREQIASIRENIGTSIEQRYRQDIVNLMQEKHIASSLFSLNEIAIKPRLLAPPVPITPYGDIPQEDITQVAIPYLPEWTSVGAAFGVKTLGIPEAMSRGSNLLIMGKPGSGKTFALSHLASQVAMRHPDVGILGRLVPVMLHVGEFGLTRKNDDPVDVFYNALWKQVSATVESQLKNFLKTIFESGITLFIIDGFDELPHEGLGSYINFIRRIQGKYPGNRYVIATSTEDISGYDSLNLYPIPIAAWTMTQKREFVYRWSKLWNKYIQNQSWAESLPKSIDPMLMNNWLLFFTDICSPLQLTLKTWALYAGDLLGPNEVDALEAYITRMTTGVINARPALEQLAMQMILSLEPFIERKAAGDFIAVYEDDTYQTLDDIQDFTPQSSEDPLTKSKGKTIDASSPLYDEELVELLNELEDIESLDEEDTEENDEVFEEALSAVENEIETIKKRQVRRILPELVKSEVLTYRPDSLVSFSHPVVNSYLAACGISSRGGTQEFISQPEWTGKLLTSDFLSAKGDIDPLIDLFINDGKYDPIKRNLLSMGNWPKLAPKAAPWRNKVLRVMADVLQKTTYPLGLRARALSALANSGESGTAKLFQQMLKSDEHSTRWLGALGCGLIRDIKSEDTLGHLLLSENSIFINRAACISLIAIDTHKSIELVARALLEANEEARRAAAEGLAHHPVEGHAILKEGAVHEDILVRRAVVFGLGIVREPWAIDILEKMQVEDDQWVVRNAATQALEDIRKVDPAIPAPLPELHETPWLIQFASERGMGVSPGQGGWDMLATALKEGNEDQRLAAMDIYRLKPSESRSVIPTLYQIMNGPEGDVREAAYNTLWHIAASGIKLPAAES
jgi:HEAT repeat protein